jgi:flagellar motor switch protein FliG
MTQNTDENKREDETIHLLGVEKAAILFLCLQEDQGPELMQLLDESDIQSITKAMATLGTIPASSVEAVIRDFSSHMNGSAGVIGSYDAAQRLLAGFLPENKVKEIMSEIRHPDTGRSIWEAFSGLNEQVIAAYLRGEHDQTIAAVMSKVKPEVAARVLPMFGDERMVEIADRMIGLDSLPQIVLDEIEAGIQEEILSAATRKSGPDPHQRMADMFNRMDGDTFEKLADELSSRAPQELDSIKEKMFTFDDLVKLDIQSLQRLMRNCEGNTLPLALRGAKKEVRDAFVQSLTRRAQETLDDQMKTMGAVRMRDVRDAQAAIIDIANDLAQQNIIRLPKDDDEMIE